MFACDKWKCRACGHINRGSNLNHCEMCNDSKKFGESLVVLPGDWKCASCGISNFAKRKSCFRCLAAKNLVKPVSGEVVPAKSSLTPEIDSTTLVKEPYVICPDTQSQENCTTLAACSDILVKDSLTADDIVEVGDATEENIDHQDVFAFLPKRRRRNSSLSTNIDGVEFNDKIEKEEVLKDDTKSENPGNNDPLELDTGRTESTFQSNVLSLLERQATALENLATGIDAIVRALDKH